jgi:hypothetical protein
MSLVDDVNGIASRNSALIRRVDDALKNLLRKSMELKDMVLELRA